MRRETGSGTVMGVSALAWCLHWPNIHTFGVFLIARQQACPIGITPFLLGIGNHSVIVVQKTTSLKFTPPGVVGHANNHQEMTIASVVQA